MNLLRDQRVQIGVGAVAAILLAVLFAVFMLRQPKPVAATADQPRGALQVDAVHDEAKVSQTKPLRCFVGGQYVGDFPVLECAKRNGVAAQSLDVGLDPATGQMAGGATALQPLAAPMPSAAPAPAAPTTAIANPSQPTAAGDCLQYVGGEWRGAGSGMSVGQCARALFDGRCVRAGDALYGRSGALTVRLVPGRVEISSDNRGFRTLMPQDPDDCTLPPG